MLKVRSRPILAFLDNVDASQWRRARSWDDRDRADPSTDPVQKCKDRPYTKFQHGFVDLAHLAVALRSNFTEVKMIRSTKWRGALLVVCLTLAAVASPAHADEVPIITGEHWTKSSEQLKKAYLLGIANVLQIESAYQGSNPPSDTQSLVSTAAKGLRGQTLDSVRDTLDRWYAANPDKLNRPVFETLWYEIVVPGSRKPA